MGYLIVLFFKMLRINNITNYYLKTIIFSCALSFVSIFYFNSPVLFVFNFNLNQIIIKAKETTQVCSNITELRTEKKHFLNN